MWCFETLEVLYHNKHNCYKDMSGKACMHRTSLGALEHTQGPDKPAGVPKVEGLRCNWKQVHVSMYKSIPHLHQKLLQDTKCTTPPPFEAGSSLRICMQDSGLCMGEAPTPIDSISNPPLPLELINCGWVVVFCHMLS